VLGRTDRPALVACVSISASSTALVDECAECRGAAEFFSSRREVLPEGGAGECVAVVWKERWRTLIE
jgi:hypothetical protein